MNKILELFSTAGAKLAQIDSKDCSITTEREINSIWTFNLSYPIPADEDKSSYLTTYNNRLRINDLDTGIFHDYIILRTIRSRNQNGGTVLQCSGINKFMWDASNTVITGTFDYQNVTVTTVLTKILSYLTTAYAVGGIDYTAKISLLIDWETVASALYRLLQLCQAELDIDDVRATINLLEEVNGDEGSEIPPGE